MTYYDLIAADGTTVLLSRVTLSPTQPDLKPGQSWRVSTLPPPSAQEVANATDYPRLATLQTALEADAIYITLKNSNFTYSQIQTWVTNNFTAPTFNATHRAAFTFLACLAALALRRMK